MAIVLWTGLARHQLDGGSLRFRCQDGIDDAIGITPVFSPVSSVNLVVEGRVTSLEFDIPANPTCMDVPLVLFLCAAIPGTNVPVH